MPAPSLMSMAKDAGIPMKRAEELWDKAKKSAEDQGRKEDWKYIMGIWKKMAKVESQEITINDLVEFAMLGNDAKDIINFMEQKPTKKELLARFGDKKAEPFKDIPGKGKGK